MIKGGVFMSEYVIVNGELKHYGVKGMKWGVRKATKLLSKATTREERDKAVASLQKHREKSTAKIAKLNKKAVKLQKKVDEKIRVNDPRAAKLQAKAAALRNKKYGLFVSKEKADQIEFKAAKIENEAKRLKALSDKAKAELTNNQRMIQAFETGIKDIDKTLAEAGKRYING